MGDERNNSAGCDAGRVTLVTGAGKGLGAAFATACVRRGSRVVVNNRHRGIDEPSAEHVARTLRSDGFDAVADLHAVDAPGAAAAIVDAAIAAYGRLDSVILNAGISGPQTAAADIDDAEFHEVMQVNFHANTALVRAALPHIAASPAGRILFVSSNAGLHGVGGRAAYAASKGALTAYALTLADEQRRAGIGVNILLPYAATSMTSARAAPDPPMPPELVAPAAVWLTSAACVVTGEIWIAGGGGFRRAQVIESIGGWQADPTPEWLAENHDALSNMIGGCGYPGAMASFLAFCEACRTCRDKGHR